MFKLDRVPARLIGGAAIAALVVGTGVGAEAATKKKKHKAKSIVRVVKMSYQGGCGVTARASGNGPSATPGQCALGDSYDLALKPGEKYSASPSPTTTCPASRRSSG